MRSCEFITPLLEYSRNITVDQFKDKLLKRINSDGTHLRYLKMGFTNDDDIIRDVIETIEKADPTKTKSYVTWIVREYIKGNLSLDDCNPNAVGKVYDTLVNYHGFKKKTGFPANVKNITSSDFKSVKNGVENFVAEYNAKQLSNIPNRGQNTVLYEDDSLRVIEPHDVAAACHYGRGTNWCTAFTVAPNRFQEYLNDGPLYIIIPKSKKYSNERYQFQFEKNRFNNDKNEIIDVMEIFETYPVLYKVFSKYRMQDKYYITKNQKYADRLWDKISLIEKTVVNELDINKKLFQFREFNKRVYDLNEKFEHQNHCAATLHDLSDFIRIYHLYHFNEDVTSMLKYADNEIRHRMFPHIENALTSSDYLDKSVIPGLIKHNSSKVPYFATPTKEYNKPPSIQTQMKIANHLNNIEKTIQDNIMTYINNAYKQIEEKINTVTNSVLNQAESLNESDPMKEFMEISDFIIASRQRRRERLERLDKGNNTQ